MELLEISMTALPEFTPGIKGRVKGALFSAQAAQERRQDSGARLL